MSYETGWFNRPYIGYVIFRDVVTLRDLSDANAELLTMLDEAIEPVHLLVKVDKLQRLAFNMKDTRKLQSVRDVITHDRLGELIAYNEGSDLFVELYNLLRAEYKASRRQETASV
ncbi:MAG: hypothetical protein L0154_23855 [Chloroflexi bacterium]|nr:hypothetical protein [Chloroflexota bacterium]